LWGNQELVEILICLTFPVQICTGPPLPLPNLLPPYIFGTYLRWSYLSSEIFNFSFQNFNFAVKNFERLSIFLQVPKRQKTMQRITPKGQNWRLPDFWNFNHILNKNCKPTSHNVHLPQNIWYWILPGKSSLKIFLSSTQTTSKFSKQELKFSVAK